MGGLRGCNLLAVVHCTTVESSLSFAWRVVYSKDRRLREVFDLVAQYWEPHPPKTKKDPKEVQQEEEQGEMQEEEGWEEEELEDDAIVEAEPEMGLNEALNKEGVEEEEQGQENPVASPVITDDVLLQALGVHLASPQVTSAFVPKSPEPVLPSPAKPAKPSVGTLPMDVEERLAAIQPFIWAEQDFNAFDPSSNF